MLFAILANRGRAELEELANCGNYVELVKLISIYDSSLEQHLHMATVFSGLSNHIQNDLIICVKNVIMKAIKDKMICRLKQPICRDFYGRNLRH